MDKTNKKTQNEEAIREECMNARALGMKAKTAIHPSQLELINEIFSPTKKEIEWAKKVVKAVEENKGKGTFSLDGKMIDKPIILKANKILDKAKTYKII